MGGRAEFLACADPEARTPIGASGNFYIVVIAEIVEIIDIGPGVS